MESAKPEVLAVLLVLLFIPGLLQARGLLEIDATADSLSQEKTLNEAMASLRSGQHEESKAIFIKAIDLASAAGDQHALGSAFNGLGIAHEYTGNYDSAFMWYRSALQIHETLHDTSGMAASIRNMAQILRVMERLEEARVYCRRAFELVPGLDDYKLVANIYNETAYLFELDNELDSARYYYSKLLELSRENEYRRGESVGLSNLADVYEREGRHELSLGLKQEGLELDRQMGDTYGMVGSWCMVAGSYLAMEKYMQALASLDSASALCDSSWLPDLDHIEGLRTRVYEAMGDYRNAFLHYKRKVQLHDSLFSIENRRNIEDIRVAYETEKKEQEILLLDRENRIKTVRLRLAWTLVLSLFLLSSAGALISILQLRARKHSIEQMKLEIRNYMLQLQRLEGENNKDRFSKLVEKYDLTPREIEILDLLSDGLPNDEIARRLFISPNTVKFHIKNIFLKLDVRNRVQALRKI